MKKLTVFSLLLVCLVDSYGQDTSKNTHHPFSKGNTSLQLHVGSAGGGLDVRTGLLSRFSGRAGFTGIPTVNLNVNGGKYNNQVSASSISGHILFDYTPFKHAKSFKIVAGAAYFDTKATVIRSTKDGAFNYGDIPLTKEEIGYVTAKTEYKGIAPYAGIGAFNIFGRKKVNVNFDFGTYYLPEPKVSLVGTQMLAGMDSQADQLQENLKEYRWLPVVQLNLIYKF